MCDTAGTRAGLGLKTCVADLVSVSSSWGVSDLESIAYQQTAHKVVDWLIV